MGEVGMAVQKRYTNKGSWDNKVHVTCNAMYYIYGSVGPSLLIESTDSMMYI